jgi:hypothetical protein
MQNTAVEGEQRARVGSEAVATLDRGWGEAEAASVCQKWAARARQWAYGQLEEGIESQENKGQAGG